MNDFLDFVSEVVVSGALSAVLVLIAGFLGRSQLSHWLNKDLEKIKNNFQKELEATKSKHQIELENYKISLIAEAEKTKANQAVKTSVALKFSEHQFNAVNAINIAYADLGNQALIIYRMCLDENFEFQEWRDKLHVMQEDFEKKSDALTKSIFSATFFMRDEHVTKLHDYCAFLCGVVEAGAVLRLRQHGKDALIELSEMAADFIKLESIGKQMELVRHKELEVTKILRVYADALLNMQNGIQ